MALGVGFQAALVILAPIALTVVIVGRIAQQPEEYISWAVFAALLISGVTTVLQAVRFGRLGSGYVLMMGTSDTFIAVCVNALVQGGPETMATLIVVSALFQFALAAKLSWLRRIFTPVVSGTIIMLIAATVIPIAFDALTVVRGSQNANGGVAGAMPSSQSGVAPAVPTHHSVRHNLRLGPGPVLRQCPGLRLCQGGDVLNGETPCHETSP